MPEQTTGSTGSTKRLSEARGWCDPDRDAEGRALCRRCNKPVPKGRRAWCSDKCVHEHRLRSDPNYARCCVRDRDHGVCVLCGLDCEAVMRGIGPAFPYGETERRPHGEDGFLRGYGDLRPGFNEWTVYWRGMGLERLPSSRMSAWDMDHETPVTEGGGECGLDNLRTLCWWCHKAETRDLHARRARRARAERRAANPQRELFDPEVTGEEAQ